MNVLLGVAAVGASLLIATVLRQPMVGLLLASSTLVATVLSRSVGLLPWMVLALKLVLVGVVSLLAPLLWPGSGGLIPVNPDQHLYVETASQIVDALRTSPLAVDYAGIVGLHNRLYSIALGWLAYLNGGGSVFLYRLFNVFVSFLLAAIAYSLACHVAPQHRSTGRLAFVTIGLLPSVNAYAMLVLRDVLLAVAVAAVALGLFSRKHWLTIAGLAVAYYTRVQLFFLLVGAAALFAALRFLRHCGRYGPALRGSLVAVFLIVGFFVAPFVLPPEYDYTHARTLASLGRFVVSVIPCLLGLDFLMVDRASLELSRSTLALTRIILFDTWLVPLMFLGSVVLYRRMDSQQREFHLWVWAVSLGYAAGYWIAYGAMSVRLMVPLYPLLLLAGPVHALNRMVAHTEKGLRNACR